MYMAGAVNAPVILVGDIERGGVLASLVGTMALLHDDERARIRGFVINKFRGMRDLLTPGIVAVEERIGRPCFGVIPFRDDIVLPEEDVLGWARSQRWKARSATRIGVVDVPYLSNFTDVDPLMEEPDVEVFPVTQNIFDVPHVLLFPGTKHTLKALTFIRQR